MLKDHLGPLSSDSAAADTVLDEVRRYHATRRGHTDAVPDDSASFSLTERDQLARDIAEIEHATAALRRGEPTLESWLNPPAVAIGKPRPVWLLVGVLWLSTALVTVGAVVAIAALVG
jgi:hypothetical protein